MSNKQPISTFLGIAAAVVLVSSSYAAIINVPGGQPTIQAGINAAVNGDEVVADVQIGENLRDLRWLRSPHGITCKKRRQKPS